jgi:hypothetical protein
MPPHCHSPNAIRVGFTGHDGLLPRFVSHHRGTGAALPEQGERSDGTNPVDRTMELARLLTNSANGKSGATWAQLTETSVEQYSKTRS